MRSVPLYNISILFFHVKLFLPFRYHAHRTGLNFQHVNEYRIHAYRLKFQFHLESMHVCLFKQLVYLYIEIMHVCLFKQSVYLYIEIMPIGSLTTSIFAYLDALLIGFHQQNMLIRLIKSACYIRISTNFQHFK